MAVYNKFQDFIEQVFRAVHNFGSHTYKVALTNTAPVNTQTGLDTVTNHPPPANVNGYTAGGTATTIAISETGGTVTVTGTQVVFTASGGTLGAFRYVILYNDSATSPADALVSWWDYASSITLADGETFTVKFNNTSPGNIFTAS